MFTGTGAQMQTAEELEAQQRARTAGDRREGEEEDHEETQERRAGEARTANVVSNSYYSAPSGGAPKTGGGGGPMDAKKRVMRDFRRVRDDPPEGVSATPSEEDIMDWSAIIFGATGTVWEGGVFKLTLMFSDEYPLVPPRVKFVTRVFHPNVYTNGDICMDILKNQWSPAYDAAALLISIQSLLADPNPLSAANAEAAELYAQNRKLYDERVSKLVEESMEAALAEAGDDSDDSCDDDVNA